VEAWTTGTGAGGRNNLGTAIVFRNWKEKRKGQPSAGSGEVSDCDFATRLRRLLTSLCVSSLLSIFLLLTCIRMCTCSTVV
jgi:hypothetical protein